MMGCANYAGISDFTERYGDAPDELTWLSASGEACRLCDLATTTADGVCKLRYAMPEGEGREAVVGCVCELTQAIIKTGEAIRTAAAARGRVEDEDGLHGGVIASVSAGCEFISYKSTTSTRSIVEAAAEDAAVRDAWYRSIIVRHLSGVADKNGVPLLFGGRYRRALCTTGA